jgi:hypothetical protein
MAGQSFQALDQVPAALVNSLQNRGTDFRRQIAGLGQSGNLVPGYGQLAKLNHFVALLARLNGRAMVSVFRRTKHFEDSCHDQPDGVTHDGDDGNDNSKEEQYGTKFHGSSSSGRRDDGRQTKSGVGVRFPPCPGTETA